MKFLVEKQRSRSESNGRKKGKGNFWLTVATFIVNKRKAFLVLFAIACIYCAACMNKVSVNQDITKYLPADSETRIGLT